MGDRSPLRCVTSVPITGLKNGTSYTFSIKASNAIGTGPAAQTTSVTPTSTVPNTADTRDGHGSKGWLDQGHMDTSDRPGTRDRQLRGHCDAHIGGRLGSGARDKWDFDHLHSPGAQPWHQLHVHGDRHQ